MSSQQALFPELAEDEPAVQTKPTLRAFLELQNHDRIIAEVIRADFEAHCKRCGITGAPWIAVFSNWVHHAGVYCAHDLYHLGWCRKPENLKKKHAIPPALRLAVFERDGFTCRYCNTPKGLLTPGVLLQADHVIPESRGGETVLENLVTACSTCNAGKSDRILRGGEDASER